MIFGFSKVKIKVIEIFTLLVIILHQIYLNIYLYFKESSYVIKVLQDLPKIQKGDIHWSGRGSGDDSCLQVSIRR